MVGFRADTIPGEFAPWLRDRPGLRSSGCAPLETRVNRQTGRAPEVRAPEVQGPAARLPGFRRGQLRLDLCVRGFTLMGGERVKYRHHKDRHEGGIHGTQDHGKN